MVRAFNHSIKSIFIIFIRVKKKSKSQRIFNESNFVLFTQKVKKNDLIRRRRDGSFICISFKKNLNLESLPRNLSNRERERGRNQIISNSEK